MLTAKDKQKDRTVVANQIIKTEETTNTHYYCISCKQRVILKQGKVRQPHFAHRAGSECAAFSENESEEHLSLKELLLEWCRKEQIPCQLEAYLPELQQRPDLLIDSRIALEIQCSPLSLERLAERTHNYKRNDYLSVWMAGNCFDFNGKLTTLLKSFACFSEKCGFYIWQLDEKEKAIKLYYQIEENHVGETLFQTKSWPFFSCSLLYILNYPTNTKTIHKRSYVLDEFLPEYYVYLQKGLRVKRSMELTIQGSFYEMGEHLLYLPSFFYYSSLSYFYLRDGGLCLRLILWKQLKSWFGSLKEFKEECLRIISKEKNIQYQFCQFAAVSKRQLITFFCYSIVREWIHCGILLEKGSFWHFCPIEKITSLEELKKALEKQKDNAFISVTPIKM